MKDAKILFVCIISLALLCGCSLNYTGTYQGTSDIGIPVEIRLEKGGNATTNLLGFPVSGTYEIKGGALELNIQSFGMTQKITGKIGSNSIEFADITLKKVN